MTGNEDNSHLYSDNNEVETHCHVDDHRSLSKICPACYRILSSGDAMRIIYDYTTYKDIKRSSKDGCQLCIFMNAQLYGVDLSDDQKLSCENLDYLLHIEAPGTRVNIYVSVVKLGPISLIPHVVEERSDSASTLALAHEWFKTCQNTHEHCIREQSRIPSRLIDIGQSHANDQIRLCTTDIPPDIQYVTLSHCWGQSKFLTLTRNNLESLRKAIDFQDFTKTFQDAVNITRQFGFRYLWIDSLCIIQGDEEDWLVEAGHMSSIYRGSSLNIAATGAQNGHDGLFFSRKVGLVQRVLVKLGVEEDLFAAIDGRLHERCVNQSPLCQRAWVFQERFLAPRTLHFGQNQIFWECGTINSFETFPEGIPSDELRRLIFYFRQHSWLKQETLGSNWKTLWEKVVSSYTRGQLTKETDKLAAISGVARVFADRYNLHYLAGIWKQELPNALLWQTNEFGVRPLPFRAPTWSWASVDGRIWTENISHGLPPDINIFKILVAETYPSEDPFGPIKSGLIKIECERLLGSKSMKVHKNFSDGLVYLRFSPPRDKVVPQDLECHFDEDIPILPDPPEQIYFLDLRTHDSSSVGLIIARDYGGRGYFRRIGKYRHGGRRYFRAALKYSTEEFDLSIYESKSRVNEEGYQMYIINLI